MIDSLKILASQPRQTIPDLAHVKLPDIFRGLPIISQQPCRDGCRACAEICPTMAIEIDPVRLDLGSCVFCGECESACPEEKITFSNAYKIATNDRHMLVVTERGNDELPFRAELVRKEIQQIFGRSLKLRQVSAGGCNACEMELNACGNINFDMGRFGIEFVASPRHADGIVITGPISENMARPLEICYQAIPAPKLVILTGACAITGGIFRESAATERSFLSKYPIDLYVPGCPPHPLTFINGLLRLIRRR